jgi:hypothetical protein
MVCPRALMSSLTLRLKHKKHFSSQGCAIVSMSFNHVKFKNRFFWHRYDFALWG